MDVWPDGIGWAYSRAVGNPNALFIRNQSSQVGLWEVICESARQYSSPCA